VGMAAALLNATAATIGRAVNAIEIVSYSLIILIGVRLLWVKGRAFVVALRTLRITCHRYLFISSSVTSSATPMMRGSPTFSIDTRRASSTRGNPS
jgi:hypothetical protein